MFSHVCILQYKVSLLEQSPVQKSTTKHKEIRKQPKEFLELLCFIPYSQLIVVQCKSINYTSPQSRLKSKIAIHETDLYLTHMNSVVFGWM